jgi:YfiH family protein
MHHQSTEPDGRINLITSSLLASSAVVHGFAERGGGVSTGRYASLNLGPLSGDDPARVRENRTRLLARAGVQRRTILAPRQVHSADVSAVRASDALPDRGVLPGDAVVSDRRDVALMILAADCVPVLMFDPERRVVAAVHAGWRGTAGAIVGQAVHVMAQQFRCRPETIVAALGPAIGRCCYEVGPDVLAAVAVATPATEPWDPLPGGKGRLDLIAANVAQLRRAGVAPAHIDATGPCTACTISRFYSHRREGEPTGRNAAVIALA